MNYFKKLINITFHPKKFLNKTLEENTLKEPLKFLAISIILANLIRFFFNLIFKLSIQNSLKEFTFNIFFNLISILVISLMFHLTIKIFEKTKGYSQSIKGFSYVSGFWVFLSLIEGLVRISPIFIILNLIVVIFGIYLLDLFLRNYYEVGFLKMILVWIFIVILLFILLMLISLLGLYTLNSIIPYSL